MATNKEKAEIIDKLLSKLEPMVARSYREGLDNIKSKIVLKEITDAINLGNTSAAFAIIDQAVVTAGFLSFQRALQTVLQEGGDLAAKFALDDSKIIFSMNVADTNTARFLRDYQATKIAQITLDSRELMSSVLRRSVAEGVNPITTAREIRDGLGLTSSQERAVKNYRRLLENLDGAALDRRLRDARFDRTVARAIREGRPLNIPQMNKMEARYRDRFILRRSQTIARTESIRLLSEGQNAFWDQAINDGVVSATDLKKFWVVTRDGRLREAHASIPRLNPKGVKKSEAFKSSLGPIRFPGDQSASAANVINCRCAVFFKVEK